MSNPLIFLPPRNSCRVPLEANTEAPVSIWSGSYTLSPSVWRLR